MCARMLECKEILCGICDGITGLVPMLPGKCSQKEKLRGKETEGRILYIMPLK
jgi:hypothetical protein